MLLLLIFILSVSLLFHIVCLIIYIYKKKLIFFKGFIASGLLNLILAMVLAILFILSPHKTQFFNMLNLQTLKTVGAGIFSLITLLVQIIISITLCKRAKNPQNYHFNYFGKKVLHKGLIKPEEITIFLTCIPCFLLFGAYFAAKVINNFLGR